MVLGMVRYLDANVFIYAFYRPKKRNLDPIARAMKDIAKSIIQKISRGEESVVMSIVHISEVCNIIKHSLPIEDLLALANTLITSRNIRVLDVSVDTYKKAISIGFEYGLEPNDALAVLLMRELGIDEIYTFDKDFDVVSWLRRRPTDEEIERRAKE